MEKKVSLTVQMTPNAMFDFLYWHSYHGIMGIVNYGFSFIALLALVFGFGKGNTIATIALIILASLFTIINPLLLYYKAVRQVKTNQMFQKPLEYIFDEKGFGVAQGEEKAFASWSDVLFLRETKKTIVLYLGAANATVLPKKDCKEYLTEIKAFIKSGNKEVAKKMK